MPLHKSASKRPAWDSLAWNSLGFGSLLFQSIGSMAPALSVIFATPIMASQGGASFPLAWIFATVGCLLTAFCLAQITKKIHSAGGYFVIHSYALGSGIGFTTSWLWLLFVGGAMAAASTWFGQAFNEFTIHYLGISTPWWVVATLVIIFVTYSAYAGIRKSAFVAVTTGLIEVGTMLLLALILIIQAGDNQPVVAFTAAASPTGWYGVFFATIYAIFTFVGFESSVPLSEESKDAKGSISRAIITATLAAGIFYIFVGYGAIAGFGFKDPISFAQEFSRSEGIFFKLGDKAFGPFIGHWLILLILLNSTFAICLTAHNAVTRIYYSLGRAGVFPLWMSHINEVTKTPDNAVLFQGAFSLVLGISMGFLLGPEMVLGLFGLISTIVLMMIYILTNVSCFFLYYFVYRQSFSVFKHLVIPVFATIILFIPLVTSIEPDIIFGHTNKYPFTLAIPIIILWFLVGVGVYFWLKKSHRSAIATLTNEMSIVEAVERQRK